MSVNVKGQTLDPKVASELGSTYQIVRHILMNYLDTRNSDRALIARVELYCKNVGIAVPPYETITRCFLKGTSVLTDDGWKNIENIKCGNNVLTHKNRFKKVINVMERNHNGDIILLRAHGNDSILKTTSEHPFLVAHHIYKRKKSIKRNINPKHPRRKHWIGYYNIIENQNLTWIEAKDLKRGNILVRPILGDTIDKNVLRMKKFSGYCKHNHVKVNDSLMKIIGYYLAEGFSVYPKPPFRTYQNMFTFGKTRKELGYVKDLSKALESLGFKNAIRWREYGWYVRNHNKQLSLFLSQFGRGAANKRLPSWVLMLPKRKLQCLLKSYLNGDGSEINDKEYQAVTVSEELAYSIKLIGEKLGYKVGISKHKPCSSTTLNIKGKHPVFKIRINMKQKRLYDRHWINRCYVFSKIRKISKENFNGKVYNIEVADDNSYVIKIGAVHNCRRKIQNIEGLFQADSDIRERRMQKGRQFREAFTQGAD